MENNPKTFKLNEGNKTAVAIKMRIKQHGVNFLPLESVLCPQCGGKISWDKTETGILRGLCPTPEICKTVFFHENGISQVFIFDTEDTAIIKGASENKFYILPEWLK